MKISATIALIVIVDLVASSSALPAKKRMVYYQPAQYYARPQRLMYLHSVQPSGQFARSTQAAEVLVAGESVASGTYLKDCEHEESDIAAAGPAIERGEDVLGAAGAHGVNAVAEAYPASGENVGIAADVDIVAEENEVAYSASGSDDAAKVPRDFNLDESAGAASGTAEQEETEIAYADQVPSVEVESSFANVPAAAPAPAPIAPVATPAKRYLPSKKRVYVQLESDEETALAAASEAEEDEELEDEEVPAAVVPARRPAVKKPAKKAAAPGAGSNKPQKPQKPLPAGTFFPIDFGGTSGGAIAIANAFSTGEGGSATSHAIAYGSPESVVRSRTRPSKIH